MALKGQMSRTILNTGFLALEISLLFCIAISDTTGNISSRPSSSNLGEIPKTTMDLDAGEILRELSIQGDLSLPVVQQPVGNTNYVSPKNGVVTQFASAALYGNIGLLAHNYLSGSNFSQLDIGHEVRLVFEDGRVKDFVVTEILRYQALEPKDPYSSFQNLDNGEEILTVRQMFDRAYVGDHHLTLQTCIAADGISSWGRLFVIALPKTQYLSMDSTHLYKVP